MAGQANGSAKKFRTTDSPAPAPLSQSLEKSSRTRRTRRRKSLFGWLFSNVTRLSLWYLIITVLFRCPSNLSDLTDESPKVCKPYLVARTHADPYVRPYYDHYLLPYVERVEPHATRFHQSVYTPTSRFVKAKYDVYGSPRVQQAQGYLEAEWDKRVKPQIDFAKGAVQEKYEQTLAPHVDRATEIIHPFTQNAKLQLNDVYTRSLIPAYEYSLPIARSAYGKAHRFTVDVALPYFWQGYDVTLVFLNRTVWPQLRTLYGENVEPQLRKITRRLGRHKNGTGFSSVTDEPSLSGTTTVESTVAAITAEESTPTVQETPTSVSSNIASASSTEEVDSPDVIREKIENDLRTWQSRFAKAADKGAEDLDEQVREITEKQVEHHVHGVGKTLIVQLEKTIRTSTEKLRDTIKDIVRNLPEDPDEELVEAACDESLLAIRTAGGSIKEKAQAVRSWKTKFDSDTLGLVQAASASTLEVIDSIRDLGLQEIGMRWAWLDGVTYKDWAKYHQLKKTFDEWAKEVESVALQHEGLLYARSEAEALEDQGLELAENAARELLRLKDVARWKAILKDDTDNFETKAIPPVVVKKAKEATEVAKDATSTLSKASETAAESAGSVAFGATESVESVASDAAESGESVASVATEDLPSIAAESIKSAASVVTDELPSSAASVASEGSESASSLASDASASVLGSDEMELKTIPEAVIASLPDSKDVPSVLSKGSASAEEAQDTVVSAAREKLEEVSEAVIGTPGPLLEEASSSVNSLASEATESVASVSKRVFGGAQAQFVAAREVVLDTPIDDDDEETTLGERMQARLEQLSSIVKDAVVGTATEPGAVESASSVASEKFDAGIAAASSILYGTKQGAVESLTSVAAAQYSSALTAASYAIYGTPTPVLQSMLAEASSRYDDAVRVARKKYDIAKKRVEEQVKGTPQPVHEQMLRSVEAAYSDAIATASSKYAALFPSIRPHVPREIPTEALVSISAVASSHLTSALDLASTQYASATKAAGLKPTPAHEKYLADARRRYYDAVGQAHAQFEEFVDSAQGVIRGTPTPAYQQIWSQASEAVLGTPTPAYASYLSVASVKYESVLSAASSSLSVALSSANAAAESASVVDQASSHYNSITSAAAASLSEASAHASSQLLGTSTGKVESMASQASESWEDAVSQVSAAIYGIATPYHQAALSQAGAYAVRATDAAAAHYQSLHALVSELLAGREPAYTDSVLNQLSSAYYTGYPAIVSAAALMADDAYSQASAAVASALAPPAVIESIILGAASQMNAALDAASTQMYGTEKGSFEKATDKVASAYKSATKVASEAVYGTSVGPVDAYQAALANAASSASSALSVAFYGTPTPTGPASVYSSVTAAAAANVEAIRARWSEALYGAPAPEPRAFESAAGRVAKAAESAGARLAKMMEEAAGKVKERVQEPRRDEL